MGTHPQNRHLEASVEQQPSDLRQLLEERPPWEQDQRLVVDPLLVPLPVMLPPLDPPPLPQADHHLEQRPPVARHSALWPQARPRPLEEEDQDSVSRQVLRQQENSSILGDRDDIRFTNNVMTTVKKHTMMT